MARSTRRIAGQSVFASACAVAVATFVVVLQVWTRDGGAIRDALASGTFRASSTETTRSDDLESTPVVAVTPDESPDGAAAEPSGPSETAPIDQPTTQPAPVVETTVPVLVEQASADVVAIERVLILGDSLIFTQADGLMREFASVGIETRFAGGSGTGLLTGQTRWLDALTTAVAEFDPDVVVIEACCNYGATPERPDLSYYRPDGSEVPADSEEMFALWATAADEAVRRASALGARVAWVITPSIGMGFAAPVADRVERFNRIARNLVTAWPDLGYIDWGLVITTSSGMIVEPPPLLDGSRPPLRPDGLHFGEGGNDLLTSFTVDAVLALELTAEPA